MATSAAPERSKESVKTEVAELLSSKGEPGIQSTLQQRIQATKKLESEIAQLKSKATKESKDASSLNDKTRELDGKSDVYTRHVEKSEADAANFPAKRAATAEDIRRRINEVGDKIGADTKSFEDKVEQDHQENVTRQAENEELQKKAEALRLEFEAQFKDYEQDWTEREKGTKATVEEALMMRTANDQLNVQHSLQARELNELIEGASNYKEQIELFTSRFGDLEGTATKPDTIRELAGKQVTALQSQLSEIEKDKAADVEEKKGYDAETSKLRLKVQQLKKKLTTVERNKAQMEAKCKDLQQKLKRKNEQEKQKEQQQQTAAPASE